MISGAGIQAKAPTLRFCLSHPAHFIALGFGSGLAPAAPGTFGTLVAIPIAAMLWRIAGDAGYLVTVAVVFAVGVWAAQRTSADLGSDDHGAIVIDEIAAFLGMLFFVGGGVVQVAYAFALFRLFDVTKPPPIRLVDARVKGGFGVMADDVLAAAFALAVYALTARLTGWPA
jgi:phosphatidylglycerophosphatase A